MAATFKPIRGSFRWRVYCDLVCWLKQHESKAFVFDMVAADRGIPKRQVQHIYDVYVRPQLRLANGRVEGLF